MAVSLKIQVQTKTLEGLINGIKDRIDRFPYYAQEVLWEDYKNAQAERWKTEGSSEEVSWPALDPKYAKYKRIKFQSFPGGGTKMMIATGKLVDSILGKNQYTLKVITPKSFVVGTTLDYAKYPAEKRPFMKFSSKTKNAWMKKLTQYLKTGES